MCKLGLCAGGGTLGDAKGRPGVPLRAGERAGGRCVGGQSTVQYVRARACVRLCLSGWLAACQSVSQSACLWLHEAR